MRADARRDIVRFSKAATKTRTTPAPSHAGPAAAVTSAATTPTPAKTSWYLAGIPVRSSVRSFSPRPIRAVFRVGRASANPSWKVRPKDRDHSAEHPPHGRPRRSSPAATTGFVTGSTIA